MGGSKDKERGKKHRGAGEGKQVMQKKTIAHYPSAIAQTVPKQRQLPPTYTLSALLLRMTDIIQYGTSLWPVGVSYPSYVPSQLLVHPQPPRWWDNKLFW